MLGVIGLLTVYSNEFPESLWHSMPSSVTELVRYLIRKCHSCHQACEVRVQLLYSAVHGKLDKLLAVNTPEV